MSGFWRSIAILLTLVVAAGGCASKQAPNKPLERYPQRELRQVPPYLKGTIMERADLLGTDALAISSYGVVANLRGTGDNRNIPRAVREYIIKEMVKHGFGGHTIPGYSQLQPEELLRDPSFAIVRVDGFIPPGARQKQTFDVQVSVSEGSYTASLAHGTLYQTDLRVGGADPVRPGGSVNIWARAAGPVFVNPTYALGTAATQPSARVSLRYGVIMDGGYAAFDRPLLLSLRTPQYSFARAVEKRIDQRFTSYSGVDPVVPGQTSKTAAARDEGIVEIFVPREFHGDWEHFTGVVLHLFMDGSPEFAPIKAKELAAEAVKPNAPLMDISYAWEGLGESALPFIQPLMTHASADVAYAAARAAAHLGDNSARAALLEMARTPKHPFRINAVQTLGSLPSSPAISHMLRQLLDVEETLVRLEAYRVLARQRDAAIFSKTIREQFVLDIIRSKGPPLVYASRQGLPRIAVFGEGLALQTPLTFTAMDHRLSISTGEQGTNVTIFYRGDEMPQALQVLSRPDVPELVARLGGEGPAGNPRLPFSYADIVGVLQSLADDGKITAPVNDGREPVAFVMQEPPRTSDSIYTAPVIPERSRPVEEEEKGSQ